MSTPDLGKNGLHDVAPHVDLTDPAMQPLLEHISKRRQLTLEAIERGLAKVIDTVGCDCENCLHEKAPVILAELEKMWRDDEAFS